MFRFREVLKFALNSKMSYHCGKLAIEWQPLQCLIFV